MKPSIFIACLFLACCSFSNGESSDPASPISPAPAEEQAGSSSSNDNLLWVYKYDGSLQCGMGHEISLRAMRKELAGIKIYGEEKKSDGLMRVAVCGSPSGQANRYRIHREDLDRAKQYGFAPWTFD